MLHAVKHRRTAVTAPEGDVPLLVRVLAGNLVTSAHILACVNTADARHLRRLHPAVCVVVADVPWCNRYRYTDTPVVDAVRWRTCFPAAVGARLTDRAVRGLLLASEPAVAVLSGVTHLELYRCWEVTDDLLLRLPTSLHVLVVYNCSRLTGDASFAHLTTLTSLDCSGTKVLRNYRADGLPPSLQKLDISWVSGWASLAHLRQLRMLRANGALSNVTLASLPPSLGELHAAQNRGLTPWAPFAHLTALRKLDVAFSGIGDASLETLPPCLESLNVRDCGNLTSAAILPHLPALQLLDVSDTAIGDALVASLPATLLELRLTWCRDVTASARLEHLYALRALHCSDTELSPAELAMCRERGCVVVAANVLRGHRSNVYSLALLPDGRLASGNYDGTVQLWDAARDGEATVVLEKHDGTVCALAVLPGGRYLAAGLSHFLSKKPGVIVVWDTSVVPPGRCATIDCDSGVNALAVLRDGRLAAGCHDGRVRLVKVGARAGAAVAALGGHTDCVTALAVLPDGTLASGSWDHTVRLWDVGARRPCVATLAGHTWCISALAVLGDGRLASGSDDWSVRLWNVIIRTCVGVLEGHRKPVYSLAALPDGQLASGSGGNAIRVWDTRHTAAAPTRSPDAAGRYGAACATPVVVLEGHGAWVNTFALLPDGRLASGSNDGTVRLWRLPSL